MLSLAKIIVLMIRALVACSWREKQRTQRNTCLTAILSITSPTWTGFYMKCTK